MTFSDLTVPEDFFYSVNVGDRVEVREAGRGTSPGRTRVYTVDHVDDKKPRFTATSGRSVRTLELVRGQQGFRALSFTRACDSFVVAEMTR